MIIRNRANGPRFSTDPVAHEVSLFTGRRDTLRTAAPAASSTARSEAPKPLHVLYPSLYEERSGFSASAIVKSFRTAFRSKAVATAKPLVELG